MPPSFVFTNDTQKVIREQLSESKALDVCKLFEPNPLHHLQDLKISKYGL